MNLRFSHVQMGLAIISLCALIISMFVTNPDQLGPFGITIWFIVLFIALANIVSLGLRAWLRWRKRSVEQRTTIRQAILFSLWATVLLALSSLRQISLRDVVLISLLVVLIEFYMRRVR